MGSRRDRIVVSALEVHADRPVPNDVLADALWGAEPPASAAKVIQGCIARLRKRLGPEAIETHAAGYRLTVPSDDVDARRFERLVRRAETLLALDERFVPFTSIRGPDTATRRFVYREPYALFSPTAQHVAYVWWELDEHGTTHMQLQLVDASEGTATRQIDHGAGVAATAWRPDGERLASADRVSHQVRIWDGRTGDLLGESPFGITFGTAGMTYLGRDQMLLGRFGGAFQRIDAQTFEPVAERFVIPRAADALTYASPDGETAAVITEAIGGGPYPENLFLSDRRLVLIDVDTQQILHELDLGFDGEWAAFSPDGGRLAVTGRGGQVALVDVATGTLVRSPAVGHDGNVTSIDYSPDGDTVVSGGVDGQVALWDGETGVLQASVQIAPAHENGIAVAVRPDGHTVVAATWDGDIHTLDVRPEQWATAACRIAGRNLTDAEWRDAFGDRPWRETCPVR